MNGPNQAGGRGHNPNLWIYLQVAPNASLCAQVEPEPFYTMCTQDTCDSPALEAACRLAAAFVHLCNRNFVPVEIPPQW